MSTFNLSANTAFAPSSLSAEKRRQIEEIIFPSSSLEKNSLGVPHFIEDAASTLLDAAVGDMLPAENDQGLKLTGGAAAAAAWCSVMYIHDVPALRAMGPSGFVDGHALFAPVEVFEKMLAEPDNGISWVQEGVAACAIAALGEESTGTWRTVSRAECREALRQLATPEKILEACDSTPEEDASRYASAIATYANGSEKDHWKALVEKAPSIPAVEMGKSWASQRWRDFAPLASPQWRWQRDSAVKKGPEAVGKWMAPFMAQLLTPEDHFRFVMGTFAILPFEFSMPERQKILSGLVSNEGCTVDMRAQAIGAASFFRDDVGPAQREKSLQLGWRIQRERALEHRQAQVTWSRANGDSLKEASALKRFSRNELYAGFSHDAVKIIRSAHYECLAAASIETGIIIREMALEDPDKAMEMLRKTPVAASCMKNSAGARHETDLFADLVELLPQWALKTSISKIAADLRFVLENGGAVESLNPEQEGRWLQWGGIAGFDEEEVHDLIKAAIKAEPSMSTQILIGIAEAEKDNWNKPDLLKMLLERGADIHAPVEQTKEGVERRLIDLIDERAAPQMRILARRHASRLQPEGAPNVVTFPQRPR